VFDCCRPNGQASEFFNMQANEICLAAVTRDGHALKFVNKQTPDICVVAIEQNEFALKKSKLKKCAFWP